MHTGQYDSKELDQFEAVLDAAVDDARRLGVKLDTPDEALWIRTRMATAIFGGAAMGEHNATRLRSHALAMVLDQGMAGLDVSRARDEDSTRRSASGR